MSLKLSALMGAALSAVSMVACAATMDITASFAPSMENPENNEFINTTPQSGYCHRWPKYCPKGSFSIGTPFIAVITHPISANNDPRDGAYFGLPGGTRSVTVKNESNGEEITVLFNLKDFSAFLRFPTDQGQKSWVGGSFVIAPSPCGTSNIGVGDSTYYAFLWRVPNKDVTCFKISSIDRTEPTKIDEISFGYKMVMPDPLKMNSGLYNGVLKLAVGPGGDIDFGDNYQVSDNQLDINFTLSVNHELKLTTTAEDQKVTLQPCAKNKVCTREEGEANWERWKVTRVTPHLTGRSDFLLSSSGSFSVYLECEQQSGPDCALKSDETAQLVPVQTLLTLPNNIVDMNTASTVSRRQLAVGKDLTKNTFVTKSFGQNKKGSIDFLVGQKDVDSMLTTRPDIYRGAVTVIFDPKIY